MKGPAEIRIEMKMIFPMEEGRETFYGITVTLRDLGFSITPSMRYNQMKIDSESGKFF
jgi:hypothetical protein